MMDTTDLLTKYIIDFKNLLSMDVYIDNHNSKIDVNDLRFQYMCDFM